MAGEGPSREQLAQKAVAVGLGGKVHFLGLRKDVSDLLSATDLYICTSDREGISLSILEAMAAERAVIATAVGGNLELIEHDETGLLIEKGDRQALVQAILSLSLDAQARRRLGQKARQKVAANFSLNRMLLDYDRLYQSMMTARADDNPIRNGSMNVSGKTLALSLLSRGGAFQLGRRLSRRRLVVLTYHRIIGRQEAGIRPPDSVFTSEFEKHVEYLVRHYHIATGEEVRLFLTEKRKLPDNSVFITFDDGYENNFVEAFPILLRHGATAAFFLTTGFIGRSGARLWFDKLDALLSLTSPGPVLDCLKSVGLPSSIKEEAGLRQWIKGLARPERDAVIEGLAQRLGADEHAANGMGVTNLMTWDQVREMVNAGMTIGSHTVSHQILAKATPEQVEEELVGSRLKIEKEYRPALLVLRLSQWRAQ